MNTEMTKDDLQKILEIFSHKEWLDDSSNALLISEHMACKAFTVDGQPSEPLVHIDGIYIGDDGDFFVTCSSKDSVDIVDTPLWNLPGKLARKYMDHLYKTFGV